MPWKTMASLRARRSSEKSGKPGQRKSVQTLVAWAIDALVLSIVLLAPTVSAQALFRDGAVTRPSRNYDVLHYEISVNLDDATRQVSGTTSITFTPLSARCDSVRFDAMNMSIKSVSLRPARALRFSSDSTNVTIRLDRRYRFEDTITVSIDYVCAPKKGLYFIQPDSTNPTRRRQIWTQGEDMDNRYWFPCHDFPDDKATSELIATVREEFTLLSNGTLLKVTADKPARKKTYHWSQSRPHASYLIMLAAGEYSVLREQYRNIPLEYYIYPDRVEDSRRAFAQTADMMRFFEETIGVPYPWEKFSQVTINNFMWGGMENTSAVTLNDGTLHDARAALDFTSDETVAHELAHQWWGDVVTCRDWRHLWLNEGFATYFEALYRGSARGPEEFQFAMYESARGIAATERALGRRPIVSDESYPTNLYGKGSWVLHMLRNLVGDEEFFRSLKLYITRHQFASVETRDFQRSLEDATGRNLDWFFEQWLYRGGHPKLAVSQSWDEERGVLRLNVAQTQTVDSLTGTFTFPLDVECTTAYGRTVKTVWVTKVEEEFFIPLPGKPKMVIVDPGKKLLKSLQFPKTEEELVFELTHATDVVDRIIAAKELRKYPNNATVFTALRHCAVLDPFWGVRREATISLGVMTHDSLKQALFDVYADKKSAVRGAAIMALDKFTAADVVRFLESATQKESSYVVLGYCIATLAKTDSLRAFDYARLYLGMDSYRDIIRRTSLSILRGLDTPQSIPLVIPFTEPGNASDIRQLALNVLGESDRRGGLARPVLYKLINDHDAGVRSTAVSLLHMWGDEDARGAIERRKGVEKDKDVLGMIDRALSGDPP